MCSAVQAAVAAVAGALAELASAPRRVQLVAARWLRDALEDSSSGGQGATPLASPPEDVPTAMLAAPTRAPTPCDGPGPSADSYRIRAFAAAAAGPLRTAILHFYAQAGGA